jgi:hypothetical protein
MAASIAGQLPEAELVRWLGYPRGRRLEGLVLDRVDQARCWYAAHGRPFLALRSVGIESIDGQEIRLRGGANLTSRSLAEKCLEFDVCTLVCAALSAGPEIDAQVEELWACDKPDEAFILDRLGVVVTEYLRMELRTRIEQEADASGFSVLAAGGPGYSGWSLDDQVVMLGLLTQQGGAVLPGALSVLASGMLRPKLSMLLAFPLAVASTSRLDVGLSCCVCNYVNCPYRRMSFSGRPSSPDQAALREAR